jgi:hypothetical protein
VSDNPDNAPADQAEHTSRTREAYDQLAAVWSATTDDGPHNGFLERPAAAGPGHRGCRVDVSPRMITEGRVPSFIFDRLWLQPVREEA